MRFILASLALSASIVLAQKVEHGNCGPQYGGKTCALASDCCSKYGWCDTSAAHCDPQYVSRRPLLSSPQMLTDGLPGHA